MKKRILTALLAVSLLPVYPAAKADAETTEAAAASRHFEAGTYREGSVIVTIASPKKTTLAKRGQTFLDSDITVEDSWNFGTAEVLGETEEQSDYLKDKTFYVSKVTSDTYSTEELVQKLEKNAYVVTVEPDYYQEKMSISHDTFSDYQWYLDAGGAFSDSGTGIGYTASRTLTPSAESVVAIVDTGIDYTHEDLAAHMWVNTYSGLSGTYGYDFGDHDTDPMDTDEDGHGTHCAGVIGAVSDNDLGTAGISQNVKLMALKIFDSQGSASNSAIIEAFNYIYKAQKLGVNISAVNCSWGGGSSSSTMQSLVEKIGKKGALFLFASGNDGTNQDAVSEKKCPYDLPKDYTMIVGACDKDDTAAGFSDYGASQVDLFAPGCQILSTINQTSFMPAIYPEDLRNSLCSYYSSCSGSDIPLVASLDLEPAFGGVSVTSITHAAKDYFGKESDGSIRIGILPSQYASQSKATLTLYLDVTGLNLTPGLVYFKSYDIGFTDDQQDFSWEHMSGQIGSSSFVSYENKTYLKMVSLTGNFKSMNEVYVDNLAISTANPNQTLFGKYGFMDGTSMATPLVSGAVALAASVFPEDTATQRKERLLSCVRKNNALASKCSSSGVLDLTNLATSTVTPVKTVTKVTLNKSTAVLHAKGRLKLKAKITPADATNAKIEWSSSSKKYATVSKKGVVRAKKKGIGHTVKITAKAADGSGKKAVCRIRIKK